MSRRLRSAAVAACAVAWMAVAHTGSAQQRDRLAAARSAVLVASARSDSLHRIIAADSIRTLRLTTLRRFAGAEVRGDSAVVPPAFIRALDSAFRAASGQVRAMLGSATDTLLTGILVTVSPDSAVAADGRANTVAVRTRGPEKFGFHYSAEDTRDPDVKKLTGMFLGWYGWMAGHKLPAPIQRWARADLPMVELAPYVNENAYVRLAIVRPDIWRACLDGLPRACRTALAIVPNNDTISAWFSVEQQRMIVAELYRARSNWNNTIELQRQCVDKHIDAACHSVMELHSGYEPRMSPTNSDSRRALLRRAVIRGGPDGYRRLIASNATNVESILEATAGVPIDSIVDAWRADVHAAQPPAPTPTPVEFFGAGMLGVLAIGLGARRRP